MALTPLDLFPSHGVQKEYLPMDRYHLLIATFPILLKK
ncbi:hypothetical protein YpUG050454_0696 [Yersinia pestis biovar Antiqua str. UG05-0454]|nr:hypothetical protein YpUG050454_0696 [Yersinia pestis biovar Antiqua str. UG05-0454]